MTTIWERFHLLHKPSSLVKERLSNLNQTKIHLVWTSGNVINIVPLILLFHCHEIIIRPNTLFKTQGVGMLETEK